MVREGELAVIAFLRAFLIIFGIKKPVTESRAFVSGRQTGRQSWVSQAVRRLICSRGILKYLLRPLHGPSRIA